VNRPAARFEIKTLGCFSITLDGEAVATNWPDETLKTCFCSLLSPLDLYFSWDRICRAMLSVPDTMHNRQQLEESIIRPLKNFLIMELGFNPLLTGEEYISIDQRRAKVDAFEFHSSAVEGLRQLAQGNHAASQQNLGRAKALYAGSYLPGVHGKIIENTRKELEALHQKVILDSARQVAASSDRLHKQAAAHI
jgi:two-component SAPR family response regulator